MDYKTLIERGDLDFNSLSDIEKDLYVTLDFMLVYEMSGFTHYFSTERSRHLPRLIDFLDRVNAPNRVWIVKVMDRIMLEIGSFHPHDVEEFFRNAGDEQHLEINQWGQQYYSGLPEMWICIDRHLINLGHPPTSK